MDHDKRHNKPPFFSGLWPVARVCGAKTRSGGLCQKWAMKGKTRCKLHGGASTGPVTLSGKERLRAARLKHGRYSVERLSARLTDRMVRYIQKERNLTESSAAWCRSLIEKQLTPPDWKKYYAMWLRFKKIRNQRNEPVALPPEKPPKPWKLECKYGNTIIIFQSD